MKKSKLFITTPLLLAPIVTTLPLVTSCSNKTADITVSSEFAANVNVEAISEKLEVGEGYYISLSIKDEQVGKQYLPTSLTTVKTGDTELTEISLASNGILDYYTYTPYSNNTKALLYIRLVRGSISIEAKTSAIKSVTATGIDLTGTAIAEFEVGEYLTSYTTRVVAAANLENGESFYLDRDSYTITLKNGPKFGEKFTETQTQSTGTVSYNGLTSNTFNYKVIEATQAYLTYELLSTTKISKFTSIQDAIKEYNDSPDYGTYTITLVSGEYDFEEENLEITQSKGKYLTLQADYDPEYEDGEMQYAVTFKHSYSDDDKSLITIKADAADTSMSSIEIRGIKFDAPTTEGTGLTNNIDILLDTATNSVHDISIKHCKFLGSKDDATIVNAIATTNNVAAPKTIYIGSCIGQYLHNLYSGVVGHNASSSSYDLTLMTVLLKDSTQLFDINGSEVVTLTDNVRAYLMYEPTEETTKIDGGLVINGTGTYDIRSCSFNQLTPMSEDVTIAGFIKTNLLAGSTGSTKQINLYNSEFVKSESEEGSALHSIWNATDTQDEDWSLSITHKSGLIDNTTIYGKDDGTNHNYWDAQ